MTKNKIFYLLIFIILFGFSSCATDPLLRKYIVGAWQPVKLGSVDITKFLPRDDTLQHQFTQNDYESMLEIKKSLKPQDAVSDGSSPESGLTQMLHEASTPYKFITQGYYGERMNPGHPIRGTWKLKKKGTKLVLTDATTKEQFILVIDSLSSDKMTATNKLLPNGLKVTYLKNK